MRELQKFEVDGMTYQVGHWSVDKANGYLIWLIKTLGNGVANLLASGKDLQDLMDTDMKSAGAMFHSFMKAINENVTEADLVKRSRGICEGVVCGGKPIEFNEHFTGRLLHMYKVMFYVLRAQYSDFLAESQDAVGLLAKS